MMQTKYVWILLVNGLVFILGYSYLIQPASYQIASLQTEVQKILDQQHKLDSRPNVAHENKSIMMPQDPHVFTIMTLLSLHQLKIIDFNFAPQTTLLNEGILRVAVVGSFKQVSALLLEINQTEAQLLRDFSYRLHDQDQILLEMTIMLWKGIPKKVRPATEASLQHNPFCYQPEDYPKVLRLNSFSLTQLKWVGLYRWGREQKVIFMLPNQAMLTVGVNDAIGVEAGKIIRIDNQQITFRLANGRDFNFKMAMS